MADIWDNLNATKIGDDPGTIINTQTRNIHLERGNKGLLSDVNLINDATFRSDSGPIPGTMVIDQFSTSIDDDFLEMFEPIEGEVWEFIPQWEINRADSVSFYMGTAADKDMIRMAYFSGTGPDLGNEFPSYLTIMYPYTLYVYISNSSGQNALSLVRHRTR